jgi:hypothetical protein
MPAKRLDCGSLLPLYGSRSLLRVAGIAPLLRPTRSRLRPPQSGSRLPQSKALRAYGAGQMNFASVAFP